MKNNTKRKILLLGGAVCYNFFVYCGGRQIAQDFHHYSFAISFDDDIPVLPWTILIYCGAYLFWTVNYCLATMYDRSGGDRFIMSHYIGEAICFLSFILLPTTMARPGISGDSLFGHLLIFAYSVDSPDNLMPSIHCFASWLCWIGVRKNTRIPQWYQNTSLMIAIAICLSTLTVKQHVIMDVAAGILLAELSYFIAGLGRPLKVSEQSI